MWEAATCASVPRIGQIVIAASVFPALRQCCALPPCALTSCLHSFHAIAKPRTFVLYLLAGFTGCGCRRGTLYHWCDDLTREMPTCTMQRMSHSSRGGNVAPIYTMPAHAHAERGSHAWPQTVFDNSSQDLLLLLLTRRLAYLLLWKEQFQLNERQFGDEANTVAKMLHISAGTIAFVCHRLCHATKRFRDTVQSGRHKA